MKIDLKNIPIREVIAGYKDSAEEGVVAYGGKLNIRPKYQREFVYKEKDRNAVIETIKNKFPLNVMYWMIREDGGYEMLDGQQRTISIGQYVNGDFSFNNRYFHNLTKEEQDDIYDYELMIYHCEGTDKERLDWFRIINIAGVELSDQEIRNAVYTGPWLSDAKVNFSKSNCAAYLLANDGGQLISKRLNRQEYLEIALSWISHGKIEDYMAKHQHDANANELWDYFQNVIAWVRKTFTNYRKEMKGIEWGKFYNKYKDEKYDTDEIEDEILKLIDDDEVQSIKGIYPYILTREEKHLNLRQFDDKTKRKVYEKQAGICPKCKEPDNYYPIEEMEADHIKPWHEGGKTVEDNCQMLCKDHNRRKSGR